MSEQCHFEEAKYKSVKLSSLLALIQGSVFCSQPPFLLALPTAFHFSLFFLP